MSNDIVRLIFSAALAISLLLLWTKWEEYQQTPDAATTTAAGPTAQTAPPDDSDLPAPSRPLRALGDSGDNGNDGDTPSAPAPALQNAEKIVRVETDWLSAEISDLGGSITGLWLKRHRRDSDSDQPYRLFESGGDRLYIAQSGLIGENLPTHKTRFEIVGAQTVTVAGGEARVTLRARGGGVTAEKIYVFRPASYLIEVEIAVENTGDATIAPFAYYQLRHDAKPPRDYSSLRPSYFGAAMFTAADKFRKIDFEDADDDDYPKTAEDGWIGVIQQYFVAAWLAADGEREYFIRPQAGGEISAGMIFSLGNIAPGQSARSTNTLFAGAQEQHILAELNESGAAPGINLAVDYGWLTIIAVFLFRLLDIINGAVDNWGASIILLTFLVKLCFYPLSAMSYRSMAKLRTVAPQMQRMKEKYGDDKQQMQRAMMELYRREKINPLGGCLPILLQIPVFIALYWVLLASVELRHAPFALWLGDLSEADPYYILSLLMGGAMFLQTKMSPTPPDPTQAMIIKVMPLGFAIFSVFFPSGLVLYWLVNTLLSILQQWHITRGIERAAARAKSS